MFRFLAKGLLRDRSRSFFPLLIISAGVMLTVLLYSWLNGFQYMTIRENAKFSTGHVKVVTRAYEEMMDQRPLDLSILDANALQQQLKTSWPEVTWLPRIYFGGLLDLPDDQGETQAQGEVMGMAVNLLSNRDEIALLKLDTAVQSGSLPASADDALVSLDVANKLGIQIGDTVTIISSTMYGSMAMANFSVSGFVQFGVQAMDRGAVIIDISAARRMLDMEDAVSELFGLLPTYNEPYTYQMAQQFNQSTPADDVYAPVMLPLREQNNLDFLLTSMSERMGLMIFIFVFVMSLVLWNSGLMNGIRRYGEMGVRLAIGEAKGHIYRMMLLEALIIGLAGTIIGTILGLIFSYILQYTGLDISSLMRDATMIMSTTMRAQVTPVSYYIGLFPGLCASFLGALFSGVGIYRRNTAQLFKELES
jgi:putative ABC transport system permease protein